jgi:hypothetical protein
MPKLPEYLAECPEYSYNENTGMFDAIVYRTRRDGVREIVTRYSITPNVFIDSMNQRQKAIDHFHRVTNRIADIVPIKKAGS